MAESSGMPLLWRSAALCVLKGESLEGMALPKRTVVSNPRKSEMFVANLKKGIVGVRFQMDEELKERFKHHIDGRVWNAEDKWWEFPKVHLPRALTLFGGPARVTADETVKQWFKDEVIRRRDLDEIRVKEDADIRLPTFLMPLRPFQNVAVEFIVRANGRCMVADQMGVGKTPTAIAYAEYIKAKTIVVCPKSVTEHWARQVMKFTGRDSCIWTTDGHEGHANSKFHIINYDIVDDFVHKFNEMGFELLICDEATKLKNYQSARAKAVLGNWKTRRKHPGIKTKYVLFLTGTPILNRPMEAYTLLSYLDKQRFNNPAHFRERYGRSKNDAKNLKELHERTQDLVIRRLKKDVLKELPPKQRDDLIISMTAKERKEYNKYLTELFEKWNLRGRPSAAQMPPIRNFLFDLKYDRIIEFIEEMLDSGRPILVFTIHQPHAERIAAHFGVNARLVTGKITNSKVRQRNIDDLAEGKAQVGVFTIIAGGMGIDGLQDTMSDVLFVDRWWVPADHEQAEDRLYRMGQKKGTQVWYMTVKDSYDEIMAEVLTEKQLIIDQAVDGKDIEDAKIQNARGKSIFNEVVRKLASSYKQSFKDALEGEDVEILEE
jgi:SWI/SNF-related matrix-associated actin-dependent regulator 1 of chromatin subfamily A